MGRPPVAGPRTLRKYSPADTGFICREVGEGQVGAKAAEGNAGEVEGHGYKFKIVKLTTEST